MFKFNVAVTSLIFMQLSCGHPLTSPDEQAGANSELTSVTLSVPNKNEFGQKQGLAFTANSFTTHMGQMSVLTRSSLPKIPGMLAACA
jgi:hypothetical protein